LTETSHADPLTLALLTGAVAVAVGAYAVTGLAELCI
jgi:hypothetical protein